MLAGKSRLPMLRELLIDYRRAKLIMAAVRRAQGLKANAVRRARAGRLLQGGASETGIVRVRFRGQKPASVSLSGDSVSGAVTVNPGQVLRMPRNVADSWVSTQPDFWEYANG